MDEELTPTPMDMREGQVFLERQEVSKGPGQKHVHSVLGKSFGDDLGEIDKEVEGVGASEEYILGGGIYQTPHSDTGSGAK